MSKAYSSNLTQAQFELLAPLFPAAKPGGRPRSVCLWDVLNAILYVVVQGCKWRDLPADFPAWQTVYTYFRNWRQDGTWNAIHERVRGWTRAEAGCPESPSEVIVDSQSVPTGPMVHEEVGFDHGKLIKGRKRHTAVDTLGLVMMVLVSAASVPEREGGKRLLERLHQLGEKIRRLYLIWVDGGYSGQPFLQWVMDKFRWVVQVVLRPEQTQGFVLLKKRWVVERTFGWLSWYRRLNQDYKYLPETTETMIYIAMIRLMVRRLA
jgi:transposase